jgi:hypothetical protein
MIEKEIALAQLKLIEGGSEAETKYDEPVVAALPVSLLPASLPTQNQGKDPSVAADYQNAVVVYDDEQVRFTMEPEGPKIDDVPKPESTAVVLFTPLKEPEGDIVETPRRKSSRYYRHEKDELYVCSPDDLPRSSRRNRRSYSDRLKESFTFMGTDSRRNDDDFSEIPSIVQEKTTNHSDKPQDRRRSSRRNRRSYSDRLKESFTFMRTDKRRNDDNNLEDHDGVQATPGAEESGSEEIERKKRRKREERRKSRKKRSSKRSSSHKRHDESVPASIDIESASRPSIETYHPDESDQDNALSKSLISRLSQCPIFSSFRRVQYGNNLEGSDDQSAEHN